MSDDTYNVSVPIDQRVIDRSLRLAIHDQESLEDLFDDIAAILAYCKQHGEVRRSDLRANVDFKHPSGRDQQDLMDTSLLKLLAQLDYLTQRENSWVYEPASYREG